MSRRGNSLSISTILKKAQRQGISIRQLATLTDRLIEISGQTRKNVTDDSQIKVKKLLEEGIRLHPFTMQNDPFPPMEQGDGSGDIAKRGRSRTRTGQGEELRPESILGPPGQVIKPENQRPTQKPPPEEDLSLPGPALEDLTLPVEEPPAENETGP